MNKNSKNSRANDLANLGADKLAETLNDKRADIIVDKMKEDFGPRFKKIIEDPHWACCPGQEVWSQILYA